MPTIGPFAKTAKAHRQVITASTSGMTHMVAAETVKPMAVCMVSAVPT